MTRNNPASSHPVRNSHVPKGISHQMRTLVAGVSLIVASAGAYGAEKTTDPSGIHVSGEFCLTADNQPGFVKRSWESTQCVTVSTEASGAPVHEVTGEQKYAAIARIQDPEDRTRAIRWLGDEREAYYDWQEAQSQKRQAVIDQKRRISDELSIVINQQRSENEKLEAEIRADAEKMNADIKKGVYANHVLVALIASYEEALNDTNPATQINSKAVRSGMLSTIGVAREQLRIKLAMRQK